jgi:hypothetical protein
MLYARVARDGGRIEPGQRNTNRTMEKNKK